MKTKTNHSSLPKVLKGKGKGDDTSVHEVNSDCSNTFIDNLSHSANPRKRKDWKLEDDKIVVDNVFNHYTESSIKEFLRRFENIISDRIKYLQGDNRHIERRSSGLSLNKENIRELYLIKETLKVLAGKSLVESK